MMEVGFLVVFLIFKEMLLRFPHLGYEPCVLFCISFSKKLIMHRSTEVCAFLKKHDTEKYHK